MRECTKKEIVDQVIGKFSESASNYLSKNLKTNQVIEDRRQILMEDGTYLNLNMVFYTSNDDSPLKHKLVEQ